MRSAAASYQFTERFGVLVGVLFPNTHGDETRFTLHLVFSGRYRQSSA